MLCLYDMMGVALLLAAAAAVSPGQVRSGQGAGDDLCAGSLARALAVSLGLETPPHVIAPAGGRPRFGK